MIFLNILVSNKQRHTPRDESDFISRLIAGDENAFRQLVRQHQDRLFKVAYGITLDREEARDIVQDVFLKVFNNIGRFKGNSKLSTWLHRITVNQCLNWQRRWKRRFRWHHRPLETDSHIDYPELGSTDNAPDALYSEKELEHLFHEQLKALSETTRSVYLLRESEGLSYDEIADILGIKKGTVSSRLFNARKQLTKGLAPFLKSGEKED